MMQSDELVAKYRSDVPALRAFGSYLSQLVETDLVRQGQRNILQIPPMSRVKTEQSLVAKALYRNKVYADPYNDITDKVGVRFVVLLLSQISIIGEIFEKDASIDSRKDRDMEECRRNRPTVFEYQSEHYIVTLRTAVEHGGVAISRGTQCEVQIRTLLQHAYAELSHTYLYKKPVGSNTPDAERCIARAMAHIETTDNLFMDVQDLMRQQEEPIHRVLAVLARAYKQLVPQIESPPANPLNEFLLDAYRDLVQEFNESDFDRFVAAEGEAIAGEIKERHSFDLMFSLPVVLFFMYFLPERLEKIVDHLPIPRARFSGILSVKGISSSQ